MLKHTCVQKYQEPIYESTPSMTFTYKLKHYLTVWQKDSVTWSVSVETYLRMYFNYVLKELIEVGEDVDNME